MGQEKTAAVKSIDTAGMRVSVSINALTLPKRKKKEGAVNSCSAGMASLQGLEFGVSSITTEHPPTLRTSSMQAPNLRGHYTY